MANRTVNPPELDRPRGFSHAVVAGSGETIYLAGQIGAGATLPEQFDNALANLLCALRAAGGEPTDLVSLQVYVRDTAAYRAQLPALGAAWRKHLGDYYPAMGLFGVTGLFDPTSMIEVMGVAVVGDK